MNEKKFGPISPSKPIRAPKGGCFDQGVVPKSSSRGSRGLRVLEPSEKQVSSKSLAEGCAALMVTLWNVVVVFSRFSWWTKCPIVAP